MTEAGSTTRYHLSTLGEGQLRLSAVAGDSLVTARSLRLTAAGSEANVAGLVSQLGWRTCWASSLPQGELGDRVLDDYRAVGVDTSQVARTEGGRVALYFLEPGTTSTPAKVTYDREHTPFRAAGPQDYDWEVLLDTGLFFASGITLALSEQTASAVEHGLRAAHERGTRIAFDVNYRSTLWAPERARHLLERLLPLVDVLFCSRSDAQTLFGAPTVADQVPGWLQERFGTPDVVSTNGVRGISRVDSSGGTHFYEVNEVAILDRPGAGDAFVGGTLDGYLQGDIDEGVRTGRYAAHLALTHYGDLTRISRAAIRAGIHATSGILR